MMENTVCSVCGGSKPTNLDTCPHCGDSQGADASTSDTIYLNDASQTIAIDANVASFDNRPESARLQIAIDNSPTAFVYLSSEDVSIGRDPENNISIDMAEISRFQARVVNTDGAYGVIDLQSTNGTYIAGKRIAPNQFVQLNHGDDLRIGNQFGAFAKIVFLKGDRPAPAGKELSIGEFRLIDTGSFTIGRDLSSNLPLDSPVVSWRHAEVIKTDMGFQLKDLSSTNGTFLNGQLVRQALLRPGDTIHIGPFRLVWRKDGFNSYTSVGHVRLDGVQLFKEVTTAQGPRILLNNISLTIQPREFIALVGGSGAGKTTLMDALNGSRRVQSGRVLINGDDLYRNFHLYRTLLGYVPQDDIIHIGLPVGRALRYTARLRLPADTSKETIEARVNDALNKVGLDTQINQPIKSLSGGQRKRVSIAAELLSEPSLFFLDEPTSGLDPGLDRQMMDVLYKMKESGRTIVLTTHATGNIEKCNKVAFMAHGRMVYYGSPARATEFFNVNDFTDIYERLENPEEAERCEGEYHATEEYEQLIAENQSLAALPNPSPVLPQAAGPSGLDWRASIRQFGILSKRFIDLILNDKMSMFVLLAVMPIIGALLLMIANSNSLTGESAARINEILASKGSYHIVSDAQKLLLMMSLSVILLGLFAASYEIIKEKPVYRRERMVNLDIIPYLASKTAVLLGFGVVQCLALLMVIRLKVPYPTHGVFMSAPVELFITLILSLLAGVSVGLLISALVKSNNTVIYLVLLVLIVQIIFSGAFFDLPAAARPLSIVTTTRWTMEGMGATVDMNGLNQLSKQSIPDKNDSLKKETIDAAVPFDINYNSTPGHLFEVWAIQILFSGSFLSLAGWTLMRQDVR